MCLVDRGRGGKQMGYADGGGGSSVLFFSFSGVQGGYSWLTVVPGRLWWRRGGTWDMGKSCQRSAGYRCGDLAFYNALRSLAALGGHQGLFSRWPVVTRGILN